MHKSLIKFGKGAKLSPSFVGPFEVVERKGPVAYRLALPNSLRTYARCVSCFSFTSLYFRYVTCY
jgi:hypothetical protein